jgi:hypothetical protein
MFRTTPTPESTTQVVSDPSDLIPLSHLELDLPAPTTGWLIELDRRGIEVLTDDIGRAAISRDNARQLLTECRQDEIRRREAAEAAERQAVEADRVRRASIWGGVPATAIPEGVSAASAMFAADRDARPRRQSVLEEALSNSGGYTFHSLGPEGES